MSLLCFAGMEFVSSANFFSLKEMSNKLFLITFKSTVGASLSSTSRRCYSQDFKILKHSDTAHLKRGQGGKSSFNGNVVTIFGATGFFGKYICNCLGRRGAQLIIPYRCDPDNDKLKALKLAGDLGQVLFLPFSLEDPVSIRRAIKYSNVVINLIGRDFETPNYSSYKIHVKSARDIAAACREMNVERLIHFSSLNLTDAPRRYYVKKLNYLQGKLEGELAALEEYPCATIFRPSNIYGYQDRFLWPLCSKVRSFFDSVPLYAKGLKTIKQPIYALDLSQAVANAVEDYSARGKIYQAVGPERFYLKDISTFCSQVLQRHHFSENLTHDINYDIRFFFLILLVRNVFEYFSHLPIRNLAFEFIERESVTDVIDKNLPTLVDLGVTLTKFEDVVPNLIYNKFRKYSSMAISSKNYIPPSSLSKKAISEFTF